MTIAQKLEAIQETLKAANAELEKWNAQAAGLTAEQVTTPREDLGGWAIEHFRADSQDAVEALERKLEKLLSEQARQNGVQSEA